MTGPSSMYGRQRGAVLLVGLILLLMMTLVGISTMETTNMEQKMVANMSDHQVCFEAAERAVKIGEYWINTRLQQPASSTSGSGTNPVFQDLDSGWWAASPNWSSMSHQSVAAAAQESSAPIYVMEALLAGKRRDNLNSFEGGDTNNGIDFYRFTARGFGQRSNNDCIIETTFARRF